MQAMGSMAPMQPAQVQPPAPLPVASMPTGYTGKVFVPGQGGCGGGRGGGSVSGGGDPASLDAMASGAADAAAKVQQMAAGVALDYISGRGSLEGSLTDGASHVGKVAETLAGSRLAMLRFYFDVNNAYVIKKLQILLLPYRHPDWERKAVPGKEGIALRPPSEDPNAPDLYLPLMALTTYILVAGFVSGADGRFTPEVLASTASTGVAIILLEVILIKLALYLLQSEGTSVPALDLASCSGYKFVAAVFVLLTKELGGTLAGYAAIALAGGSIGTFMAKTLRQCLLQGSGFTSGFVSEGLGSPGRSERKKRQFYSLLGVGLLQPLLFWYLSRV